MKLTLDAVLDEWANDCQINATDLDGASRQSPNLHAKYLKAKATVTLRIKREEAAQKVLLKKKWLYYNGKMTEDEIIEEGWEFDPFKGLKVLKGEMNYYYDADTDIQKTEEKIAYYKTLRDTLHEIVDNIKWRHQTIGNMIKNRIFEAGG